MDIRVELFVIFEDIKCRDLVSINDEIHNILDDTCKATHVSLEEFTIKSNDKGVECVFAFVMGSESAEYLADNAISDALCQFVDDMCSIHNLKPIQFEWHRV